MTAEPLEPAGGEALFEYKLKTSTSYWKGDRLLFCLFCFVSVQKLLGGRVGADGS